MDPAIRIRVLEVSIAPVILYGVGTWTPTKGDLEKVFQAHMGMCKKILDAQRRPQEEWPEFMIRSSERIRKIWQAHGIKPWNTQVLEKIHSWAGHVARYDAYSPDRFPAIMS